jgi:hypothetical protein
MTAGIDLALGLVERDVGPEAARVVAKALVVHHRRAGGQSQHSALLEIDAKSDRVQDALVFARRNLHEPLSVEQLAEVARLSPRQFSRVFRVETGNRLRKRSRTSGWRPPSWRWNKGGAPSKKSRRKLALATGNACAERSYALLGKRRRRFGTRHTHSLRSDQPFPCMVPPSPRTWAGRSGRYRRSCRGDRSPEVAHLRRIQIAI